VRRFQRAVAELERAPRNLAKISSACGYFDQAHFIHDVRALAGATPSDLAARRRRIHVRVDRPRIYNTAQDRAAILAR
jgi:AraC-like DNA-binding protein